MRTGTDGVVDDVVGHLHLVRVEDADGRREAVMEGAATDVGDGVLPQGEEDEGVAGVVEGHPPLLTRVEELHILHPRKACKTAQLTCSD